MLDNKTSINGITADSEENAKKLAEILFNAKPSPRVPRLFDACEPVKESSEDAKLMKRGNLPILKPKSRDGITRHVDGRLAFDPEGRYYWTYAGSTFRYV